MKIILTICLIICLIILLISDIKDNYIFSKYRHPYRLSDLNNYPQFAVSESCLNTCCDYTKCIEGKGCNWKTRDGEWVVGSPYQCIKYTDCINTKNEKECLNIIK